MAKEEYILKQNKREQSKTNEASLKSAEVGGVLSLNLVVSTSMWTQEQVINEVGIRDADFIEYLIMPSVF